MKILILYWSAGGSTKKVADKIEEVLLNKEVEITKKEIKEDLNIDLYRYDLIFMGAPSYQFIPPEPVLKYVRKNMERYQKRGDREIRAPKKPGKSAIIFCTYAGIHTGVKEGYTAGKYMAQFLEHLGFMVLDEWYTVGEFQDWDKANKNGKLGNIVGRPNKNDIKVIENNTLDLMSWYNK